MKNTKLFCSIDQIDICAQTVSNLQKNGIEFIWQLALINEPSLILIVGACNSKLIHRELASFLEGCDLGCLVDLVESFLNNKISDFPEIYSLVGSNLKDKKIIYLFDAELSEAKKSMINILHQEIVKFSN